MINVLLDELPEGYETESGNYYEMDFNFRTGIQVQLAEEDPELTETEKMYVIADLLFFDSKPKTEGEFSECLSYYMGGWSHDNPGKAENRRLMDFDIDQWRIYSAFLTQYKIDLNDPETNLHWWVFMGLLTSLEDCAYTRVIDIRRRQIESDMDRKAKKALIEAKEIYELRQTRTAEEAQFEDYIDDLLCQKITPEEQARIDRFEAYGKEGEHEGQTEA